MRCVLRLALPFASPWPGPTFVVLWPDRSSRLALRPALASPCPPADHPRDFIQPRSKLLEQTRQFSFQSHIADCAAIGEIFRGWARSRPLALGDRNLRADAVLAEGLAGAVAIAATAAEPACAGPQGRADHADSSCSKAQSHESEARRTVVRRSQVVVRQFTQLCVVSRYRDQRREPAAARCRPRRGRDRAQHAHRLQLDAQFFATAGKENTAPSRPISGGRWTVRAPWGAARPRSP